MKWTNKQLEAINHSGENILVSAGAGSGKTAILSERVIRILKEGTHINELLILTFTKAASEEMKERIRKKIIKNDLYNELELLDSSYITTFDSYALSIVKKYHYLLNLDKNINIMDESILKIEKLKIINKVLEQYYISKDEGIMFLIKTMLRKDDSLLKEGLASLIDKIDLQIDSKEYLKHIKSIDINKYFTNIYNHYLDTLFTLTKEIEDILFEMENHIEISKDEDIVSKCSNYFSSLINSKTYNDIKYFIDNNKPLNLGKIANSNLSSLKKETTKVYNKIKELAIYESENFIKDHYLTSYKLSSVIYKLIEDIYYEYKQFKLDKKMYSFMDIAKLAIKVFKENESVREEIRISLKEIMIDEYQDTSSLQEEFMSYISNNNLYMVGDIKQSIYRFRYANPDLFRCKYDNYKRHDGGYLIDLNTNFRSRKEVLNNINEIFKELMTSDLGGASYKDDHMIEFGNKAYENDGIELDHNLEIYNYNKKDYGGLNSGEIEAFIVANDIKNKIKNNYHLLDKDSGNKYRASYKDFVVLVDKRSDFNNYRKIFEYFDIPSMMYENENIIGQNDMYIFKNILIILDSYKNNSFDTKFKHAFYSVSRSYLFSLTDDVIFMILNKELYKENIIFDTYKDIIESLDVLSIKELFNKIIFSSNWYDKLIYKGEAKSSEAKLAYLINLSVNLDNLDYSLNDVIDYFDVIEEKEMSIEIPMSSEDIDAVRFMTIHNSKGLEFPVCYFLGFSNRFNVNEIKDTFILTENGLILPFYVGKYKYPNIELLSYKNKYLNEEISEKIRLLYVSLTRSKEKMIIVTDINNTENKGLENANSFNNFIISINGVLNKYIKSINKDELIINRDYKKYVSNKNISNNVSDFEYDNIVNKKQILDTKKFSKDLKLEDNDSSILKLGNHLHNLLFELDFKNPDYTNIKDKDKYIINRFINSDVLDIKNAINIYKEYEFIDDNKHGFIDLIVEYEKEYRIIDYKLSNIEDNLYISQLYGYREYLKKLTKKPINLYLYSLLKGEGKKVD